MRKLALDLYQRFIRTSEYFQLVPLPVLIDFLSRLKEQKPYLQIQSIQFMKTYSVDFNNEFINEDDYTYENGGFEEQIRWVYFQSFDNRLKISKTLKVQFLELMRRNYIKYVDRLQKSKSVVTNFKRSDLILKIYDYYFVNYDEEEADTSIPLYFVVEQELVQQTSQSKKDIQKIKAECLHYLSEKMYVEKFYKPHKPRFYLVKNENENSYSLKLNPLDPILYIPKNFYILELNNNVLNDFNDNSQMQEELEMIQQDSIKHYSTCVENTKVFYEKQEFSSNEEQIITSNERPENNQFDYDQEVANGVQEEYSEGDSQIQYENEYFYSKQTKKIKQKKQIKIQKDNLVNELRKSWPQLLKYHPTDIFEVLSQHPKLDNFKLFDFDEDNFIFNVSQGGKSLILKCERQTSTFAAEETYRQYMQLYEQQHPFVPILECEIILLSNRTYIMYIEDDFYRQYNKVFNIFSLDSQIKKIDYKHECKEQYYFYESIRLKLFVWIFEQAELLQQKGNLSSLFFLLQIHICINENNQDEVKFYSQNPLFSFSKYRIQNHNFVLDEESLKLQLGKLLIVIQQFFSYRTKDRQTDQLMSDIIDYIKNFNYNSQQQYLSIEMCKSFFKHFSAFKDISILKTIQISNDFTNVQFYYEEFKYKINKIDYQTILGNPLFEDVVLNLTIKELCVMIQNFNQPIQTKRLYLQIKQQEERVHEYQLQQFTNYFQNLCSLDIEIEQDLVSLAMIKLDSLQNLENVGIKFKRNYSLAKEAINEQNNTFALYDLFNFFNKDQFRYIHLDFQYMFEAQEDHIVKNLQPQQQQREDENQEDYDIGQKQDLSYDFLEIELRSILKQHKKEQLRYELNAQQNNDIFDITFTNTSSHSHNPLFLNVKVTDGDTIQLLDFDTRLKKRFYKACEEEIFSDINTVVHQWIKEEKVKEWMNIIYTSEETSKCIHCEQLQFVRNLYHNKMKLNRLGIYFPYCQQVQQELFKNNDFLELQSLPNLHELVFLNNFKVGKQSAFVISKNINSNQFINTLVLNQKPQGKVNQILKNQLIKKVRKIVTLRFQINENSDQNCEDHYF